MNILKTEIKPGASKMLSINIAKLHSGAELKVPVLINRSLKKGPTLLIIAGIHGDEVNGVEIVRKLIQNNWHKPDKGTVIAIPLFNVFAFINLERKFPDGRDLNRLFPGSKGGPLASRFAYHLSHEILPHIDYCIDYHTGGAQRFNAAQVRVNPGDIKSLNLAKKFGAPFVVHSKNPNKSLRHYLDSIGKKVILFEGGKSLHIDKRISHFGVYGALKAMHALKMRDFTKELKGIDPVQPVVIKRSKWLRAKYSGMFRTFKSAGNLVDPSLALGSISDTIGKKETMVRAEEKGYILNVNQAAIVNQGDALYHIGYTK